MTGLDPSITGTAALLAAVAMVAGGACVWLFVVRRQPWGTVNDLASIVLMVATDPTAIYLGQRTPGPRAVAVAGTRIGKMLGAATSQPLLVLGNRTYRQLLPSTPGAGAIVGVWSLLWPGTVSSAPG